MVFSQFVCEFVGAHHLPSADTVMLMSNENKSIYYIKVFEASATDEGIMLF